MIKLGHIFVGYEHYEKRDFFFKHKFKMVRPCYLIVLAELTIYDYQEPI